MRLFIGTAFACTITASLVQAQDLGKSSPLTGCTPERFPISENGMIVYYPGPCSDLYTTSLSSSFVWQFQFTSPRFGASLDDTTSITDTSFGIDGMGNIFDSDHSEAYTTTEGEWQGTGARLHNASGSTYGQQGATINPEGLGIGFVVHDQANGSDLVVLYEYNKDAGPGTGGVGGIYNQTLQSWTIWYPEYMNTSSNHPNNKIPQGESWISFGEISESGIWVTFTSGAYLFDYSTENWTLKVSGGTATGSSESGDFLVGTSGNSSFVLGPSSYFETVSVTGYKIELYDVNEFGIAVGKATDLSTLDTHPAVWDFATETCEVFDEFDDWWLGAITDSGFGMFEDTNGDKGSASLFSYYDNSPNDCPPDLNDDDRLNFLDLSAYLVLFSNGDAGADLNRDARLNFLDLSTFLDLYSNSCSGYPTPDPLPEI